MKKYYESSCIRNADRIAIDNLGIPGIILMENAGRGAADTILRNYPEAKKALILCGSGNNGGDGFVVARHLSVRGLIPIIISAADISAYKGDAKIAADSVISSGLEILTSISLCDDEIKDSLADADVVVDALLGTGSKGAPRGEVMRLIRLCKGISPIISLDIPSGINPDTGETAEDSIYAELTVTFLAEKSGLAVTPAALRCGAVEVCDIGVRKEQLLNSTPNLYGFDRSDIRYMMPQLAPDAHKGSRGTLLIAGGSYNYRGAPILAAKAALRAGCGVVLLMIPDFAIHAASADLPEAVFIPLPTNSGRIDIDSIEMQKDDIFKWLNMCNAVVAGPGMGRSQEAAKILEYICGYWEGALLLDADALFHLSHTLKLNDKRLRRRNTVITPHTGEAARLLGTNSTEVSLKRLESCDVLANKYGTALLKGYHTLICDTTERRVILEGNTALSVPGSGDVLSGVIGTMLAKGMKCIDASTLGALLHGTSADLENGMLAGEIADGVGQQVNKNFNFK